MVMFKILINKYKFSRNPIKFCRNLGVKIGENCSIMGTHHPFGTEPYLVSIGNHVRINDGVQFITHDGGVWVLRDMPNLNKNARQLDLFGKIVVGNNVHIGSHAMIMPGVTIGSNVIIGAGAIVTKDIPDNSIAVGVPAKVLESIDDYYKKHADSFDYTKSFSAEQKREYLKKKFDTK